MDEIAIQTVTTDASLTRLCLGAGVSEGSRHFGAEPVLRARQVVCPAARLHGGSIVCCEIALY
jgi:hypothetical protein